MRHPLRLSRGASIGLMTLTLLLVADAALSQVVSGRPDRPLGPTSCWVVPHSRAHSYGSGVGSRVLVEGVKAGVVIRERVATTTLDITLKNPVAHRLEAELLVPVPAGVVVRGFDFEGTGAEPSAELLPKDEARRTYDAIVRKIKDPALLEFIGYNVIRSSVFPIEAHGTQRIRLTYEQILTAEGDRVDLVMPRSESIHYRVPWEVSVKIHSRHEIATVYSPSHPLELVRTGPGIVSARLSNTTTTQPGAFRLSYLLRESGVSASLFAYPDGPDGGYFLLLAGIPAPEEQDRTPIKREVTLVLDRSGSMNGEKIEQVREAAKQIIAGLDEGEAFNIISYNDSVDLFSARPVVKGRETEVDARIYLDALKAGGGTNLHDALAESLRIAPAEGMLPIVLFLTDGLPTVGQTSEAVISALARDGNAHERRIFTFGVGVDVNTPLLEKVSTESRATATFVLPGENVETKVARVFKRLGGPVLADPGLELVNAAGEVVTRRVSEVLPGRLPDLFEDDQLVVLGRYHGADPLRFRLGGNYLGTNKTFAFTFKTDRATTRNAFVSRLWASRKIAVLTDAVRDLGATTPVSVGGATPTDPRLKELVDEIVALSTEFGILTEYTAFLAQQGTNLSNPDAVLREATSNFANRAVNCRSGWGSVNQDINRQNQRAQSCVNITNDFFDASMNLVSVAAVQQVNDRAFYQRGQRWVDSRLVTNEDTVKPQRVITFDTEDYDRLRDLLAGRARQGCLSLAGEILIQVDGEVLLVQGPGAPPEPAPEPEVTPEPTPEGLLEGPVQGPPALQPPVKAPVNDDDC